MVPYEEALSIILEHAAPLRPKPVKLEELLGFCLAEPVITNMDLPHFDNSAVDGFGVIAADVEGVSDENPARLPLSGTIQAGDPTNFELKTGNAVKILTGAPVPPSVEAVIMREYCQEDGGSVLITRGARPGENIRRRGEEFLRGQQILPAGVRINPAVVGLLATLGYPAFPVHRKPRVVLLVTGNELVKPGKELSAGRIYNSNSYALAAAVSALGIEQCRCVRARDNRSATRKALLGALASADVVISTGGVSVGDYDYVKEVAQDIGIATVLWGIALKPGKPVYFGTYDKRAEHAVMPAWSDPNTPTLLFGLPGNPVSALVTFHQLVKPALLKMMGQAAQPSRELTATLSKPIKKKAGRMEFVRGILSCPPGQLTVSPVSGQESHMMGGLAQADCLIQFPLESEMLEAGSAVQVVLLNWSD